jgi:KUP system potassium uptake protein
VIDGERMSVTKLPLGFWRVVAQYGFMETPDAQRLLASARAFGLRAQRMETTYYLGREQLLPIGSTKLARWRKKLYAFMARNSLPATAFFGLPPNRVVELGAQLEI